ncbi:MAG: ferric reductase-like transmembrane domain-containing protein [Nocardioides sp.]
MLDGPFLWYLNRSTGMVILVLFTLSTALGVLSTRGNAGKGVPKFVTQSLHRNIALLSVSLLVAHIVTAVVDTFVDIRWWQAIVPFYGSTYLPQWLGLGTVAFDVIVVITLTSLVRDRLSHRLWRGLHLFSYVAWAVSVAHGIGIGTDIKAGATWAYAIVGGCVAVVLAAVGLRVGQLAAASAVARVDPGARSSGVGT